MAACPEPHGRRWPTLKASAIEAGHAPAPEAPPLCRCCTGAACGGERPPAALHLAALRRRRRAAKMAPGQGESRRPGPGGGGAPRPAPLPGPRPRSLGDGDAEPRATWQRRDRDVISDSQATHRMLHVKRNRRIQVIPPKNKQDVRLEGISGGHELVQLPAQSWASTERRLGLCPVRSGKPARIEILTPFWEEDRDQDAMGGKKTVNQTFLSLSQITALSEQNVEGVQRKLEEFLDFKQLKTSLKEAILLDYYTAGFWWAKEMNFSLIQLSGFMDLLNFLLENLSDKHMTLVDNLKELGRALAGIGETDSERSGDLNFFSIEQAKAVIDYLNISLFKHYKLYEYLFHSHGEELVISNENVIELAQPAVPPFPALLEEGIPLDTYSSFIVSLTAAETELKGSDQEGYLEDSCPEAESFEADAVPDVTAEDQKPAVGEIPNEIIGNLEAEINEKLQMQEEAYTLRTEKLKSPK
ncbi:ciliary-associated calcium-binding coiled-coil protein 1 [Strix aluco]|uniref:ciliary-associated calcium-binding coiled-coil protein 1 n=1 Tax=Strix aluco TaxID=111821 RepID=UPI003DA1DAFC